ncbi:MAG: acetyl-CoA carboxylase carboxyltransferase subunit alpha [Gammaproteobacteria bacterium]|nr:acetyl-CoA carboxylase carboxyltransferase subunit alpha [Gammaproteobacteria bacterium]
MVMNLNFLDFEQPIAELDAQIKELQQVGLEEKRDLSKDIAKLDKKRQKLIQTIFADLTPWQVVRVARHPQRPHTVDYLSSLFTEFDELHGDRMFGDDGAIMGGLARFNGEPVMVIGQEKGRTTKEKVHHNFGLPRPEGYRKALRLMRLAEHFAIPIITFIDTQGAYPGIDAEERGQSEAIARNIFVMSTLKTPIICIVIGEGGSGGALALGVGDRVIMMQYTIYSVISPEGCATILWRSAERAPEAAENLKLTAQDAKRFKLIDEVLAEPAGGAHRDFAAASEGVREVIARNLAELQAEKIDILLKKRYERMMRFGLDSHANSQGK